MRGLAGLLKYGQFLNRVRRRVVPEVWPTFRPHFASCSKPGLAGFLKYLHFLCRSSLAGFLKYQGGDGLAQRTRSGLGLAGFLKYRRKRSASGLAGFFKYRPGVVVTLENRIFNKINNLG